MLKGVYPSSQTFFWLILLLRAVGLACRVGVTRRWLFLAWLIGEAKLKEGKGGMQWKIRVGDVLSEIALTIFRKRARREGALRDKLEGPASISVPFQNLLFCVF